MSSVQAPVWPHDFANWDHCDRQNCYEDPAVKSNVAQHWYWDGKRYRLYCSQECFDHEHPKVLGVLARGLGVASQREA